MQTAPGGLELVGFLASSTGRILAPEDGVDDVDAGDSQEQYGCGNQECKSGIDEARGERCYRRSRDAPRQSSRADESEQPLSLPRVESVVRVGPELTDDQDG